MEDDKLEQGESGMGEETQPERKRRKIPNRKARARKAKQRDAGSAAGADSTSMEVNSTGEALANADPLNGASTSAGQCEDTAMDDFTLPPPLSRSVGSTSATQLGSSTAHLRLASTAGPSFATAPSAPSGQGQQGSADSANKSLGQTRKGMARMSKDEDVLIADPRYKLARNNKRLMRQLTGARTDEDLLPTERGNEPAVAAILEAYRDAKNENPEMERDIERSVEIVRQAEKAFWDTYG